MNYSAKSDLKYILQWTNSKHEPFMYMGVGQQGFIDRKCKYTNCFVTDDRDYLGDVTKFDVIAFAGPEVVHMNETKLPKKRSPHQKYAFTNIESADNYPACTNRFDNFFNWTWTYRLDSETKWGYLIVRDAENNIIGPNTEMHWMKIKDMDPIDDALRVKLRNKTKAAAWFVSNCRSRSGRENFVKHLQKALKSYDLTVDIYGKCGPLKCGRDKAAECNDMVERDYYFYLSFENSFAKDYVTEKLLYGLQHNAVPIVYGGANYTRFMPDGIYLNARQLGPEALAKKMKHLIDNNDQYEDYFRWKKYYSFHNRNENAETDDYCGFCNLLNNKEMVKKTSIYNNFKQWWNPPNRCP
ncbi:alpha-(1,3)-fucosyltransferase C-like isoform X1 [Choristoneura fumiferana]|uniref:alpha-(1,3)-fucosyltransferase C-like isoform X1 n=2 Tax=Choristoneura fumiferana TaxID=7141 RepID=UPI003D15BF6F